MEGAATKQLLFVTATASWCEVCHLMEQSVFLDTRVGTIYNKNFYSIKLDIERLTGPLFALRYGIDTLPAFLFLSPDGTLIHKAIGYKKATELVLMAQNSMDPQRLTEAMTIRYTEGDRKPDFLLHYLAQLPPDRHGPIIQEYLDNRKSWNDPNTIKLLWLLDDTLLVENFDRFLIERAAISKVVSKDKFEEKLNDLIDQRLYCSTPALTLDQAQALLTKAATGGSDRIYAAYKVYYYKEVVKDPSAFILAQVSSWQLSPPEDVNIFNEEFNTILGLSPKPLIHDQTAKLFKKNSLLSESPYSLYLQAVLCQQQGAPRKSLKWLKRSQKADTHAAYTNLINTLRHTIRS